MVKNKPIDGKVEEAHWKTSESSAGAIKQRPRTGNWSKICAGKSSGLFSYYDISNIVETLYHQKFVVYSLCASCHSRHWK